MDRTQGTTQKAQDRPLLNFFGMLVSLCSLFIGSACVSPSDSLVAGSSDVILDTPSDTNGDVTKTVCDPFSNNPSHLGASARLGIAASLYYLPDGAVHYTNVFDYQTHGTQVDATLFLSEVNIPTRLFNLGFSTQSGTTLTNQDGNTLYEYFSLHLETSIQLTSNQADGAFQFALLSDDGAVLQINTGAGFQTLIDDNQTHPTRAAGATLPVQLNHQVSLPIKLDYFQGPRYNIALMLMWRPWPKGDNPNAPVNDPVFGQSGNELFFDYTKVPSVPTNTYKGMLTRGWQPVPAANFVLPSSIASNPCTVGAVPSAPLGVSTACTTGTFTPKSAIRVGLSIDPNEGSIDSTIYGLKAAGFTPIVYSNADIQAQKPIVDGVSALILSRVVTLAPVTAGYIAGIQAYLAQGGSILGEYDGAGLIFSSFSGSNSVIPNFSAPLSLFTGAVTGGGSLLPVGSSTLTVTDAADPLMQNLPATFVDGALTAFAISGQNTDWIHTSATFTSSGFNSLVPAGTFPAVMKAQCGAGRIVLLPMSEFSVITDAPIQALLQNAIHWLSGI